MAIWQFDCHIIPKEKAGIMDCLDFDEILTWRKRDMSIEKIDFLDKRKSWSDGFVRIQKGFFRNYRNNREHKAELDGGHEPWHPDGSRECRDHCRVREKVRKSHGVFGMGCDTHLLGEQQHSPYRANSKPPLEVVVAD